MSLQSPPPVKPTGRKLVGMLGFGSNAQEQFLPPMVQGPLEISGIPKGREKENAPLQLFISPE